MITTPADLLFSFLFYLAIVWDDLKSRHDLETAGWKEFW